MTNIQPPFQRGLGYTVKRLHQLIDQHTNDVLRPYGLARSQWFVLLILSQLEIMTQKELQSYLEVEAATLTVLIGALERKGLIVRSAIASDRRARSLQLTPIGKRLWATLPDPIAVTRQRMLAGIAPAEEAAVKRLLDQAIHNLERT